jgi:hypothetical protein
LNGITRFATGFPVNIRQGGDFSLVGSGSTDVPDHVGSVRTQDPRNSGPNGEPNLYFFRDAFSLAPLGRFGTSNRRFFHGPGFDNWDFGLHKDTRIAESMAIQFRLEFFNLFNHAQFYNPAGNIRSAQFGQVSGARDPRIGQMSLKFLW